MTKRAKNELINLMVKILSFNSSNNSSEFRNNSEKENFLKKLWNSFQSLDKFNKIFILFILLFTLTVPVVTKQYLDTRQRAAENKGNEVSVANDSKEKPKYNGYIIELKSDSLVEHAKDAGGVKGSANSPEFIDYKKTLFSEHENAKKDILARLSKNADASSNQESNKSDKTILREYMNAFSGFALDISDDEAKKIKNESPYVKNIYPNYEVKTQLMDSVPLINANNVWQIKDSQGVAVTGKGVKIAIIDTGIDYTHPDLGATNITDRNFEKIPSSTDAWYGFALSNINQIIALDGNRLAYSNGNKIYIYSFDTKVAKEIPLYESNLTPTRLAMQGNLLIYFAYNTSVQPDFGAALYSYSFETNTNKKIAKTYEIGAITVFNGKAAYERGDYESKKTRLYLYDSQTGNEKLITNDYSDFYEPRGSGDFVAYVIKQIPTCFNKGVIYNVSTGESRDINPPNLGPILDIKGNKILYIACGLGGNTYYLYDIATNESIRLSYYQNDNIATSDLNNNKLEKQGITWGANGVIGHIEDRIIYFSQNMSRGKIVAYDQIKNRYVLINLTKISTDFDSEDNRVCFVSEGYIYCHNYDSNYSYPLPENYFNNKVIDGYNFILNNNDPMDDFGHGTHVAAIAAGNGILKGVAPDAKLIAYKVMDSAGMGYTTNIASAIDKAVATKLDTDSNNDIDVINLSLGLGCNKYFGNYTSDCGPDDFLSKVIDNAVNAGLIVAVAAGNDGPGKSTVASPGTSRRAITVGAVDKNGKIADFSSRGPVVWNGEDIKKPDIIAPGVSICAAEWDSAWSSSQCIDTKHIRISGTSMATPHVAGVAALLKQLHPEWMPEQIKFAIKSTAKNLEYSYDEQGTGLVDVLAASLYGFITPTSIATPTPTLAPTPILLSPTKLNLNLYLDGIGFKSRTYDNRNPVIGKRTLTLQVFDLNNNLLLEKTGEVNYLDTSGTFKGIIDLGYTLKTGTYNVKIRMEKYLKKAIKNIQVNANTNNTTSETALLPGDINLVKDQSGNTIVGDNKVNLTDYQTFYSCLSSTTTNCINKADLNSDNRVNLSDYSLLMKNYGKVGD